MAYEALATDRDADLPGWSQRERTTQKSDLELRRCTPGSAKLRQSQACVIGPGGGQRVRVVISGVFHRTGVQVQKCGQAVRVC
jgi:hypothetical protein